MFNLWVGKNPWRSVWQPTPVFLPGELHGQRNLAGYSSWSCRESTQLSTHAPLPHPEFPHILLHGDLPHPLPPKYFAIFAASLSIVFQVVDCDPLLFSH